MATQFVTDVQGNKTAKTFNVIIEQDNEGFYIASVPELKGCHTQAKSLDVLLDRIKEAIALCMEVDDIAFPNQFVGFQRISVSV
jgi:predicted RNase H-like HicB family nuclease